jgi:small subunit ribosomal protein S7
MSRNFIKKKHPHAVDPIFQSRLLNIFVKRWIRDGKKSLSYRVFYSVLYTIQQKTRGIPIAIIEHRVRMVRPLIDVRSVRIRRAVYIVPIEVDQQLGVCNSIRWIRASAKVRQGKSIIFRLSEEIISSACGIGSSIRKREEVHRLAESNKAFSRYRFSNR